VHGDAPWRLIRDTAKEVMNAIHDTSKDDAPAAPIKKMEGFGGGGGGGGAVDEFRNTPSGGGGGGSFGAGGQGNFDARGAPGAVGAFMNKAQAVVGQSEFGAKALDVAGQAVGAVGFGQQQAGDSYSAAAGGPGGMPGQPGGPGGPPQDGWNSTTTSAQHQQAQAQVKSSMPQRIKVEAGEYEAKIIDDLCEPSGARPNPSKQVLDKFVQQCGSLDANLCCALLEEKLEDEDWKVVVKALFGITVLVEKGKDGVVEYFGEGNDEFIKEIALDPESQKSLKLAAEKCLKAIEKATAEPEVADSSMDMFSGMMTMDGGDAAPSMDIMGGAPAPAAPAPAMDLSFMGAMGGPVTLQTPAAAAPQPTAEEAAPPVDPMFAGVGAAAAAPAPPAGGMDLLGGFSAGAPAPAPPAAGGMLAGFGAPAPAPAMGGMMGAPAAAPAAAPGGMDLMGMFNAGGPAPAPAMGGMMGGMPGMAPMGQQPPMNGMMGGMPGMAAPAPAAAAPAPAPGGGAFDFLG
jgi:hypothetical protein